MSLVGRPRPVVQAELAEYKEEKATLLSVKPSIKGYWQVNGRSSAGYSERSNLEFCYSEKSFRFP